MSESDKKEVENQSAAGETEAMKKFKAAVKEGGKQGLKKAFNVLSGGAPTALLDCNHLQEAVAARNPDRNFQLEVVEETIQQGRQLCSGGEFTCREFLQLIKLLEEPGEANQTKNIGEKLKAGERIVLYGEKGVGKTWMAREVAALALREGDFDAAIWVYLNRNYDEFSLLESIAYQLNVLAAFEKSEAEEKAKAEEEAKKKAGNDEIIEETKKIEEKMMEITKKIQEANTKPKKTREEKIMERIQEAIKGKRLLIILDSVGGRMQAQVEKKEKITSDEGETKEKQVSKKPFLELKVSSGGGVEIKVEFQDLKSYKVVMTRRAGNSRNNDEIMVKRFTWNDSKELATREKVAENIEEEAGKLAHYFMFMSERLPPQLLLISRIVSHFAKQEEGLKKLEDDREMVRNSEDVNVLDVLIKGYDKIPKSVLIDCYSPETPGDHFLLGGRKVNFNALICYWIIERHLGHFHRLEDAYFQGHRVLMELINCGLLLQQEADYVVASEATRFHLDIEDYKDFFSGIRPGLAVTFDMRLGRVALADGMIKTIGKSKMMPAEADGMEKTIGKSKMMPAEADGTEKKIKSEIISTLLLDGDRISEKKSPTETLCKHKDEVQVLAINHPTSQHFELPILEMPKLRLLALRGCQFLGDLRFLLMKSDEKKKANPGPSAAVEKPPEVKPGAPAAIEMLTPKPEAGPDPSLDSMVSEKLEDLTVLEISGPTCFKTIPPGIFSLMPNLKTLNLSNLVKVTSLPDSFYQLIQMEFLILRGCASLIGLKSIKNFKELKVLDVSDATSFEKFEDKSLHSNAKLQVLNLSNTSLKTLPLINQLQDLKFVWLRDCAELPRIRKLDRMRSLMIFDIAGAVQVERFCDPSLEDLKNLVIVDISRTGIKRLPANIGDPTYLYAENCPNIKSVPPVEGLQKLQFLHLSGCQRLAKIRSEIFDKVKGLRDLDLSRTKVEELPFLSSLTSLRRLLLSECESLKKLEKLSELKELEHLDLSGCKSLVELEDGTFNDMKHLQHLDLSGTGLKTLPSLSKLSSLKELHVRDCANLSELPDMDEILGLDVLDYSGTVLASSPKLTIRDPLHPRVIGAGIEKFDTNQLFKDLGAEKQSDDSQQSDNQGGDRKFTHGEVSLCKWNISNWGTEEEAAKKLGTPVYGAHFLRLLGKYEKFLENNLSKFRFLVYPSQLRFPDDFKASYSDELSLRDIYFKQVCNEKIQRCLEIRGFNKLPASLRPVIERAELVVLVDDPFLRSLPDLGVNRNMAMKACWIESCNELVHVVAVPDKVEEPAETTESGVKQKKIAAGKLAELKGEGNQHKKAGAGKVGESTKSEGDQPKTAASVEKSSKSEGDEQKNAAAAAAATSKSEGDEQKNAATATASEKSQESSKSEGGEQNNAATVTAAASEKSKESSKSEGGEQKNAATDTDSGKSQESSKREGDEQKNAATAAVSEKSQESSKSEGDEQKNAATATSASEKSKESSKSEGGEQNNAVTATATAEKSLESSKSEGGEQNNAATATSTASEKIPESSKSEGDEQKNAATATTAEKTEGHEELKNPAEDLNKLETLWISDVSKLKSILKGDIQSISFKLLKSLYLEYCPNLSALTSSSSQLQSLETLYIKYCKNLSRLFTDDDSPKLDNLRTLQLWGLDSLEKISCKAPLLKKLRVGQCRLLEHVIPSRLGEDGATRHENEGHDSLEVLHIQSCDNLKSICESSSQDVQLENLTSLKTLELSGLPKLKIVVRAVPTLSVVRVSDCPSLERVVAGGSVPNLDQPAIDNKSFKKMEVRSCERMSKIIDGGESVLVNLEKLELLGLPELESIGAKLHKPQVEKVRACPKLKLQYEQV